MEAEEGRLSLSVSVTTRPARSGEVDGNDYHFVDEERFQSLRDEGALLEWAQVFGNYYGTPRKDVEELLVSGRDVLFDVDWQGARKLAESLPEDVVRVFILPPSAQALEARLQSRNQDSAEVVKHRMAQASNEISHWAEYDYVVVNDDIPSSLAHLITILRAERLKRSRCGGLRSFVEALQKDLGRIWS